jgi:histidinol-phosphate/aromatic aminotransferase/cobyric acid decarboxylase-like protein
MSTRPHELNKNESASPPPAEVLTAVAKAAAEPNRYPTLFAEPLIARLADWLDLSTANLAVGPGSATLFQ